MQNRGMEDDRPPDNLIVFMASIHNTLIFKACKHFLLDYGERVTVRGAPTLIPEVSDNDFLTYSGVRDMDIDISELGNPTRVDAFFLVSKNVTHHTGTPSGGSGRGWTNRVVPDTVENYQGDAVDTTIDGFQHDLYLLPSHFTATSVRLRFQGRGIQIYELMLLELALELDANTSDFVAIDPKDVDKAGRLDTTPPGTLTRAVGYGGSRKRRVIDFTLEMIPGVSNVDNPDEFFHFMEHTPRIVFAEAFSETPQYVYPAIFGSLRVPVRYRSDYKPAGYTLPFRVMER